MTTQPLKYTHRCVNYLFGYCKKGVKGKETSNPDKTVVFTSVSGDCEENWQECKSFVSNLVANPYHPELDKKKEEEVVTAGK